MKDKKEIIKYKFMLLGDSQVGKSAIFHKLAKDEFLETNVSTQGQDHIEIYFNDLEIDINGVKENKCFDITLFDTAGQERFRSVTTNFVKHADGIILIYDITSRNSFDHVDEWLSSIKENHDISNYLIMLLGNKLDLVDEDETLRKVSIEEENKYENKYIMIGGECSAKSFPKSQIENLLKNFTVHLYNKIGNNANKNKKLQIRPKQKTTNCC